MKKSWKPQHRCSFFANTLIYIVLTIISIPICCILSFVFQSVIGMFPIVFFVGLWFSCARYLNLFSDYGYSKLTIDKISRVIIFDDTYRIPFSAVANIKFKTEEIRDVYYNNPNADDDNFFRFRNSGRNISGILTSFCSSMNVTTTDGQNIKFYIDYRNEAKDILSWVRSCGFKVTASEDFEANASGLVAIIFIVVPIIIWGIFQMMTSGH